MLKNLSFTSRCGSVPTTEYLLKKPNNAKRVVKLSVATFHQIATVDATAGLKI